MADEGTLQLEDSVNGISGTDTLIVHANANHLLSNYLPGPDNLKSIEVVSLIATRHTNYDFSNYGDVQLVELVGGRTIDGSTSEVILTQNQSLTLNRIADGDFNAASIQDGGLRIARGC